eukprot:scaffold3426_cov145-Amphora_coffeaeformis.AAC.11
MNNQSREEVVASSTPPPISEPKKTSVENFKRQEDMMQDLLMERMNLPAGETEDWALAQVNVEDTAVKSLEDEFHRLQVLKSYNVAGVKGVDSVDRLVGTAAAVFDMPICVVSLVDMRRLWFLSTQGLGDLREIPRKDTLCSHAVCNIQDILVVPDCIEDFRFRDLFTVTGEPHLRFYAGACLKTPEGFNIGNFCVLDTKPHPEGLSEIQTKILKDFAATSMKLLEDRRYKQEVEMVKQPILARTAHELMTPLTAINLSLEALKDDDLQSPEVQKEMIDTAAASSELMTNICRKMISTFRGDEPPSQANSKQNADKTVRIADLIKNLEQITRPIPKRVPVLFQVHPAATQLILKDDLVAFRVALCFLAIACARTEHGSVLFSVRAEDSEIVFECQDSAGSISSHDKKFLFAPVPGRGMEDKPLLGLSCSTSLLESIGSNYGYKANQNGSTFWFSMSSPVLRSALLDVLQPEILAKQEDAHTMVASSLILPSKRRRGSGYSSASERSCADSSERTNSKKIHKMPFENHNPSSPSLFDGTLLTDFCVSASTADASSRLESSKSSMKRDMISTTGKTVAEGAQGQPSGVSSVTASPRSISTQVSCDEPQHWNKRALVIDDCLVIRKSLSRSLSKHGYEVVVAEDGQKGLEEMKRSMFDFVLCDFLMPVMDGLDCVKHFRAWESKHRPGFYQCILGISAHADPKDLDKGIKVGMDKYFTKPISFKLLKVFTETADEVRKKNTCSAPPLTHEQASKSRENSFDERERTALLEERVRHLEEILLSERRSPTIPKETGVAPSAQADRPSRKPSCLYASSSKEIDKGVRDLEKDGWLCKKVCCCEDALRLLKKRNWDAVVIDSNLAPNGGLEAVSQFREWERKNRINRQSNVLLKFNCLGSDNEAEESPGVASLVRIAMPAIQAPPGFDGGVRSEQLFEDFHAQIRRETDTFSGIGTSLSIISH